MTTTTLFSARLNRRIRTSPSPSAEACRVEVDLLRRLPSFAVVGMSSAAVREAADFVRSSVTGAGITWPRCRVVAAITGEATGDLAPQHLHLPLALAVAAAAEGLALPERLGAVGALSLVGEVLPITGLIAAVEAMLGAGATTILVPLRGPLGGLRLHLTAHPTDALIIAVETLSEALTVIRQGAQGAHSTIKGYSPEEVRHLTAAGATTPDGIVGYTLQMEHVLAHDAELDLIADAVVEGAPAVRLIAPQAAQVSMLAARLPLLLGPPSVEALADIAKVMELCMVRSDHRRPFRAPHHTVGARGLLGEVAMARHGVLYLDDAPSFADEPLVQAAAALLFGPPVLVVLSGSPLVAKRLEWIGSLFGARRVVELRPLGSSDILAAVGTGRSAAEVLTAATARRAARAAEVPTSAPRE